MCGINGIVGAPPGHPDARALVAAMNAALAHRGRDGDGLWGDGQAVLGHRRLSIIDLSSRGNQPMPSDTGGQMLVCNGEIYNFPALRKTLADYRFSSGTDVETILPLYQRHGADCVARLDGMFAFGLWDAPMRSLLLARDRIGEKPLYYAQGDGWLAFSSEIKGLLALPFVDRRLDEAAIPYMMAYQGLPAPVTMFCGIRMLPPASILTWRDGKVETACYWRGDFSRRRRWNWNDALDAYGEVLGSSVQGCLLADVPLGVMLSGGVDSGTVAALAMDGKQQINSFCIGDDQPGRPDIEFLRARQAADHLGIANHRNIQYDTPTLADLPRVLAQYDQPLWNYVMLYADRLAALMRPEVKAVLSGNGGDEVFAGYAAYVKVSLRAPMHRLAGLLPAGLAGLAPAHLRDQAQQFIAASHGPLESWRGQMITLGMRRLMQRICSPRFAAAWGAADPGAAATAAAAECNAETLLDATIYADLMVCHQHSHTLIADSSGMAHGLELRAPYLAHHVVEFAMSLPTDMLVGWPWQAQETKRIAKRYLERHLPHDLVYAPKVGFGYNIRIDEFFRGRWAPALRRLLLQGRYLELDIFTRSGAEWALAHSFAATAMLLSFAVWAELYLFGRGIGELEAEIARDLAPSAHAA